LRATAKLISILFHPLILPCYAFALVYFTNPLLFSAYGDKQLFQIFLTAFINTFLFPVIAILLIRALGFVKSLQMDDPKERLIPFLATGVFYIWGYVVFRKSGMPQVLDIILLGATITLFSVFMLNLFWKISAHMAAMGCMIVLAIALTVISASDMNYIVIVSVLLAGMIGSSRLLLSAHSTVEIFVGFFIGIISQMVAMQFY
jgi:membrane-associated phospholipid phosphatase